MSHSDPVKALSAELVGTGSSSLLHTLTFLALILVQPRCPERTSEPGAVQGEDPGSRSRARELVLLLNLLLDPGPDPEVDLHLMLILQDFRTKQKKECFPALSAHNLILSELFGPEKKTSSDWPTADKTVPLRRCCWINLSSPRTNKKLLSQFKAPLHYVTPRLAHHKESLSVVPSGISGYCSFGCCSAATFTLASVSRSQGSDGRGQY